ncbi:SHOCT domain-containing protein [Mycobacterium sp. 134]|uniref:SHOCT domain-containing protein n=1 Tax=Mycobacterium sp. 134 TaxID=3400425 RepID=UPI003AAB6536
MSTFWRYVRIQSFVLLCGIVGPIFLTIYFVSGGDPMMKWMFWVGLLITAIDVLIALGLTAAGTKSAAQNEKLEQIGVLALAQVTGIHETNTRINEQPLVKLDLQISAPGIAPFASQDRVLASVSRLPMITNRKLVALVDPTTNEYRIDWERSSLVSGLMPATFTIAEDNKTYDLTGQSGPLMEILQILKAHGIGINNMIDLRANPGVRDQVQAVVRRAATNSSRERSSAAQQAPTTSVAASDPGAPAAPFLAPPAPSTAQRLQELETLRATGAISDDEYTAKRQQIIADL